MKAEEFDQITAALMKTAEDISKAKRPAYTVGNVDVLHNFKSVAQRLGVSPGQALAVYMLKHMDAIITALTKPELPQAEEITGRFADAINYLKMGYALLKEPQIKSAPKVVQAEQAAKDAFFEGFIKKQQAEQEREQERRKWQDAFNQAPKATTTLQDVDWQRGSNQGAISNDPAQTQALGEYMQRVRRSEVKPDPGKPVPRSLAEQSHQSGVWSSGIPDYVGREASGGCSDPYSGSTPGITVQLFELPPDTSPL